MSRVKTAMVIAAVFLIAGLPLSSQGLSGGAKSTTCKIIISTNVPNAVIYVDDGRITGNTATVKAGTHTIKVTAAGYYDWVQSVDVRINMTITATLKSQGHQVTFNSNVKDASIFVDGAQITGTVVLLLPGNHSIRVTASGYLDYVSTVNVTGPIVLNAQLKSAGHQVTINVGVPGALIFVDGAQIAGNAAMLLPGNHSIRVTASGYLDYVTTVNVTGPIVLNAQLKSAGHQVTINTGVPGALIFVDGAQIAGNAVMLLPGNHSVRVTASGYLDYVTTVNVTGPIVLNAQLKAAGYQVTINTNVVDPAIYVDGAPIAGNSVVLLPGNHSLRITAQGYQDYNTTLKVAGPMQVNAQLAIAGFLLTVTSDVRGASVSINNAVKGTVPYSEYLPPGTYMIAVAAPGYMNYVTSVALNGPMTVDAQLVSSAPATVSFIIPREFLDKNNKDPHGQIKILVDGKVVSVRGDPKSIKVQPGQHTIEVTSGGLTVQTASFDFAPGASYSVELFMELQMKAVSTN
jgi:nitrogen fixation protein